MNNSTGSGGSDASGNVGTFPYIVGISVGVLFLLTTVTIATYLCTRTTVPQLNRRRRPGERRDVIVDFGPGLEDEAINEYPKILYSEKKLEGKMESAAASGCSICLGDYKNEDVLRLLPDCGHMFHSGCIDPWLRLNPSCPVCRTSPVPTPLSTPLAEVVPLANGRS
ncbi:RING-H2 finger protein ATL70-like [Cucurbita maxima]|uniref:RING-H2 finger protein ATL70-like n=1 Tax=Cucurbita maxima TaxID=3661 RepID=A0A6J1J186_CUCMA|nr:RING-H2 finger protein ATL70-like [Cucurbita maxima]